jgi:phenylacetate-CoA ligase
MPLIRYRIGDVGVSGGARQCSCGRGFEVMESVSGRETDIIHTPSGNRLIVHFFTGILEYFSEIDTFQVVQDDMDAITLRIVPSQGFTADTARNIVATLQKKGAYSLRIDIELVQAIPLTSGGKRRFVINNIVSNDHHQPSVS